MITPNWYLYHPSTRMLFISSIVGFPVLMGIVIYFLLTTQMPLILSIAVLVLLIIEPPFSYFLLKPMYIDSRGTVTKSFKWVPPEQVQNNIEDTLNDLKLKFERSEKVLLPGFYLYNFRFVYNLPTVGLVLRLRELVANNKEGKVWKVYIKDLNATGSAVTNQKADIVNKLKARLDQNLEQWIIQP